MEYGSDTDRRLRQLADRLELQELIVRYAICLDSRDFDGLRELWATDAVFDSVAGRSAGRDAVVDYYRERLRSWGITFHIPHGQVLNTLTDDEAEGIVLAHSEVVMGGTALYSALRYRDRYRREDGAWRFQERVVQQMYTLPFEQLSSGLPATNRKRWPGTAPQPADIPETLPSWQRYYG